MSVNSDELRKRRYLRTILILLSAALLLVVGKARAQSDSEPFKLKGVYIGQTVQDYLLNGPAKARFARFDVNDCSHAAKKNNDIAGPSDRELCQQFARARTGEKVTIRLLYTFPGETSFDKGRVTDFSDVVVPDLDQSSAWEKVLYDIKKKLGNPTDSRPIIMQNGFGATFSYESAIWQLHDPTGEHYLFAREAPLENADATINIVLIALTSKNAVQHEKELESKPSTIE
jgi:hypothetical protein